MIRIAIVEDDQSADDQLTACLEKLSLQSKEVFDLSHYPDAQQFLFAFHSQFDLIFMDIEMPNMDGLSAARRMREIDSNVALVFVTNLARYAINGYEVSALDYILKPLDYDAFYLKMQKVLRYCQTQQQRGNSQWRGQNRGQQRIKTHVQFLLRCSVCAPSGEYPASGAQGGSNSMCRTWRTMTCRFCVGSTAAPAIAGRRLRA